jgi:hypothetical protein
MVVVSRQQIVRQLPLLGLAGDNPASCREKIAPIPDPEVASLNPALIDGVCMEANRSRQNLTGLGHCDKIILFEG